ncbi:hypothetical protein LBMAG42_40070 [Deltaproteobacteria bacterium]|nr:hypothetical protein LBMAG42_40070 [Deltaproteobacteria bacterium]
MLYLLPLLSIALAEDLSVSSNIKGLSIVVDGTDTGLRTPAVVTGLSPGRVAVVVGDACRAGDAMVEVESGRTASVNIRAEEQLATLTVAVKPAQAVVDVNNGTVRLSPNVPVGLPCGTYEIKASLKGYSQAAYTLELIGGQELELPIELERLGMSTVEISVEPRTASILFDGKEVGKDAASLPSVYEGQHTLGATLKGYDDAEAPIQVRGGDNLVFKIELARGDDDSVVKAVGGAGSEALAKGKANVATSAGEPDDAEEPDEEEPEPVVKATTKSTSKTTPKPLKDAPDPDLLDDPDDEDEDPNDDTQEPDADLAPVKSWSEMHSEAAKKEEKAEPVAKSSKASKSAYDDLDSVAKVEKKPKAGQHAAGGVLLAVGAVAGGGAGIYFYTEAAGAYDNYLAKQSDADDASGDEQVRKQKIADTYYTDEFAPKGNLMVGSFIGGGVVAATGLLLLVVDGDGAPFIAPAPGGGMVGWSASF